MTTRKLLKLQLGDAFVQIPIDEDAKENWKLVRDFVDKWIQRLEAKEEGES